MHSLRITKIEAHHSTGMLLHFPDGSVIEVVPVQVSGFKKLLDAQQTALVALWDLLRRSGRSGEQRPRWEG
jgi:hypothetical protein